MRPGAAEREEARAKANFCLRMGMDPRAYDSLTDIELEEFRAEANRIRTEIANQTH